MDEQGRRTRWGSEILNLFGKEFYRRVVYYDVVGCSFSSALHTLVITDLDLFIYELGSKKIPDPYCKLTEISEIDSDHETPETFRAHPSYEPHRIIIRVRNEYHALYTFETGTDLFWRLTNAVENAKRHFVSHVEDGATTDPEKIDVVTHNGTTITLYHHYVKRFNRIASHVIHEKNIEARLNALAELDKISNEYFPIRVIFFQSSPLVQYLMDTLSFLSDFHTVPAQIATDRVHHITLIKTILETFQFYLKGSTSVQEALRLISFNSGEHYNTLITTMFDVEFFILSQPQRGSFFLKHIIDKSTYLSELQAVEMLVPSLCYTLYGLGNIATRSLKDGSDIFLDVIKKKSESIITGGFHTIAYTTVQLAYLLKDKAELPGTFAYTFLDHLWFLNYISSRFPAAARVLKDEFEVEINVILTEERVSKDCFPDFPLYDDMKNLLSSLKQIMRDVPAKRGPMSNLPVQFK
jgi:hypothetical protein